MVQVLVDDVVIADSDDVKVVEGGFYFPPSAVKKEFLKDSDLHTVCHWKGNASYYNLEVNGNTIENAAWYYPDPITDRAMPIKDYISFYPNLVTIKR